MIRAPKDGGMIGLLTCSEGDGSVFDALRGFFREVTIIAKKLAS
jgi:hypothetical protein